MKYYALLRTKPITCAESTGNASRLATCRDGVLGSLRDGTCRRYTTSFRFLDRGGKATRRDRPASVSLSIQPVPVIPVRLQKVEFSPEQGFF